MLWKSACTKVGVAVALCFSFSAGAHAYCYGFVVGSAGSGYQTVFEVSSQNCPNAQTSPEYVEVCTKSSQGSSYYPYCTTVTIASATAQVSVQAPNPYGVNYSRVRYLDNYGQYRVIPGTENVPFNGPLYDPGTGGGSGGGGGGNECPPPDIHPEECNNWGQG